MVLAVSRKTWVVGDAPARLGDTNVLLEYGNALGQGGQHTHVGRWSYVAVKDRQWNGQRSDGVGHVDDAADPAFAWDATQQQVHLLFRVAKLGQVLDAVEHGALVGNRGVWKRTDH
jgi:hypothetical protein